MEQKLAKMISTRVEEGNIAAIDKVARSQGLSRSDWIRRAILAQLVLDLTEMKKAEEVKVEILLPQSREEAETMMGAEIAATMFPPEPDVPRGTPQPVPEIEAPVVPIRKIEGIGHR